MFKILTSLGWLALALWMRAADTEEAAHWAYAPLAERQLPPKLTNDWARTPIDRFIAAQLSTNGLAPAETADRRTLLRRVHLDLVGLPPSPAEVNAFLSDTNHDAYERVVDRLLASPRHGERWARHWLDVIHFAETHGHDQDRIRTNAWPYRDYLIDSFNKDKPYKRFVEEQVAGDVLFPDDPQATVALGFLAAGPWDESSLRDIREDTIDRQIARYLDRDDVVTTVMQTFTSTTVQCARCHNHKFDPIPQTDYYKLQAVFAGVDRANRAYDADPDVFQKRMALRREEERASADRAWLLGTDVAQRVTKFEESYRRARGQWRILEPETFVSTGGASLVRQTNGALLATGPRPERETYVVTGVSDLPVVRAVRLEVLTDDSLPKGGPGRADNGNLHLSEFQLMVFEPGSSGSRPVPIARASADFNQAGWTIEHALDGKEKTAWGIHPEVGRSHYAIFQLKEPVTLTPASKLTFVLKQLHGEGHVIGRFRIAVSGEASAEHLALPVELEGTLARAGSERTEDERVALAKFIVQSQVREQLAALPKPSLVYAAASEFEPDGGHKPAGTPRPVHVLRRGDIHRPLQPAMPGALSCVDVKPSAFELEDPNREGPRRAALAKWLTAPGNVLTWRSIVNRVWHYHFGRGLVETPNDFGKMGKNPSHPELLDWLAVWFRDDAGGSLKALHRMIVTSATYRQSSSSANESRAAAVDAENRLLWRMHRARLDADQVRDSILLVSGALDLRMGGPSDMQFDLQPGHHVTPKVDYAKFDVNAPQARRRSVYRFLFRTLPDPFMDALDCPAGDQLTPVRNASVTVQQALAMWNDAFVANYAEHAGTRVRTQAKDLEAQVTLACESVWCRPPAAGELRELIAYAQTHGMPNLYRVLFNSNEFMFVN